MPARSAFNEERRGMIVAAVRLGASHRTAAAIAGVGEASLRRWLSQGKAASSGRFKEFYDAVEEAEAAARLQVLTIIYKAMPDNPMLAWKFLERREPGFERPSVALAMRDEFEELEPPTPRDGVLHFRHREPPERSRK